MLQKDVASGHSMINHHRNETSSHSAIQNKQDKSSYFVWKLKNKIMQRNDQNPHKTSRSTSQNSSFVFGKSRLQISARRPATDCLSFSLLFLPSVHIKGGMVYLIDHYHFLPHFYTSSFVSYPIIRRYTA
jgi:hypothetical protein